MVSGAVGRLLGSDDVVERGDQDARQSGLLANLAFETADRSIDSSHQTGHARIELSIQRKRSSRQYGAGSGVPVSRRDFMPDTMYGNPRTKSAYILLSSVMS